MSDTTSSGEIIVDRRQASRVPFEVKMTVSCLGAVQTAVTQNLTSEGAFLLTNELLPPASDVELSFDLDDGATPIRLSGRVVRLHCDAKDGSGFAVEFDAIERDDAERIAAATR